MTFRSSIRKNEIIINRLHKTMHSANEQKNKSIAHLEAWKATCREFHENYSRLIYLFQFSDYRVELRGGNTEAIEYAISFIEVRPYFFRSGYLYKDLIRVLRSCPLNKSHRERYQIISERYKEYQQQKNKSHCLSPKI
jgi:hypothetical protein